jgi:multidrug resistance efflux pump
MLDKTDLDNTLKTESETLINAQSNLETTILDTAVILSDARDNIKNLQFTIDEAKITLEQSQFEPPATIRKAEMELNRDIRAFEQAQKGYGLKMEQSLTDLKTIQTTLQKQQTKVNDLENVLTKFEIRSPGPGMVIYKKDQQGNKRKVGSSISSFDLVVATLPDMSSMVSRTYANEIDITKIKIGMPVKIQIDAFPEKHYTGVVTSVSNVGEQLPNADSKVFEVLIKINESDEILRPAMTSANRIIIKTIKDAVSIPINSVQTEEDKTFVYMKDKKKKQEIILGEMNEDKVVIIQGLNPGDIIYLNNPNENK